MGTCFGEEKSGFPVQPDEKIRKNRVFLSTYRESSYHTFDNSVVRHIPHFFQPHAHVQPKIFMTSWIWQSKRLKTHEIIHTDEKRFSCSKCEKKFSQSQHFKTNEQIHTDEKPFSCSKCEKKFSSSGNLKTQERIHTVEKPSSCSKCERKFRQLA